MSSAPSPEPSGSRVALFEAIYRKACLTELRALKPGNVHIHSDGHGMTIADFERSAEVSAAPLCAWGQPIGRRIRDATVATRSALGANTNLGILLLAAPLIAAAQSWAAGALRHALASTLNGLTVEDAIDVYEAIRLARPAGLGAVTEQDIDAAPTVDLRKAMGLAADRDRVARQYATCYADIFELGIVRLREARLASVGPEHSASYAYMSFLASFPDSHIARKFGRECAETVRLQANTIVHGLRSAEDIERRSSILLEFDRTLKAQGFNPGTSADLTVASLLALDIADMLDPVDNAGVGIRPT